MNHTGSSFYYCINNIIFLWYNIAILQLPISFKKPVMEYTMEYLGWNNPDTYTLKYLLQMGARDYALLPVLDKTTIHSITGHVLSTWDHSQ